MNNRCLLILFSFLFLTAETQSFADEEPVRRQIQQWCRQLGDDSFIVRKRAESLLIQIGIQAYPELQRAKQSSDVEIVRRAEYILSRIEQAMLDSENKETAVWFQFYMIAANPVYKARIIWFLADPASDFNKGEGLQTLCRFVRFEESDALRLEAVKSLIASPPFAPSLRQQWYRYIRDNVHDTGEDALLECLARYAKLWCDLDDAEEKITPEFQDRVRQVGTETLQLLNRPENSIQIGNKIDLLLHYAVAELQDTVALIEERDKTITKVRAIEPQSIQTSEPVESIVSIVDDNLLMSGHFYVGYCLKQRYRLHWAAAHFQKVIETGDILLRVGACDNAADIALYLTDYASAIAFIDKYIENLEKTDYQKKYGDAQQRIILAKKRKAYCLAEQAATKEDWESVQKIIMESWAMPDVPDSVADSNQIILAYRLCKKKNDVSLEFKDTMNLRLKQVWQAIENDFFRSVSDQRSAAMIGMCNAAAWILANTGGDYQTALIFAEIAQKGEPEDAGILDTLAHVYFLGNQIDSAVRIQEQVIRMAPEAVIFRQALERFQQSK